LAVACASLALAACSTDTDTAGPDYLVGYENVQDLPKGRTVTLRYLVALDASMHDGQGGLEAVAVVPDPLVQIGKSNLPFSVAATPGAPAAQPTAVCGAAARAHLPIPPGDQRRRLERRQQTELPFTGLENSQHLAVDSSANVYVAAPPTGNSCRKSDRRGWSCRPVGGLRYRFRSDTDE
jgi:hypothetical protein